MAANAAVRVDGHVERDGGRDRASTRSAFTTGWYVDEVQARGVYFARGPDRITHVEALMDRGAAERGSASTTAETPDDGHPHLIGGEFQSDKYPTCPRGKVPLSVKDPTAQDLLWEYAQRRRPVDAEFATDLEKALRTKGFVPRPTQLASLAKWITEHTHRFLGSWRDHACSRCVPDGEIVIPGFICAVHLAEDIAMGVSEARDPANKPPTTCGERSEDGKAAPEPRTAEVSAGLTSEQWRDLTNGRADDATCAKMGLLLQRGRDEAPDKNVRRWSRVLTIADVIEGELGEELAAMAHAALDDKPGSESATVDGPEVSWTSNGDAGDSSGHCSNCGEERDEAHTWKACAERLAREVERWNGIAHDPEHARALLRDIGPRSAETAAEHHATDCCGVCGRLFPPLNLPEGHEGQATHCNCDGTFVVTLFDSYQCPDPAHKDARDPPHATPEAKPQWTGEEMDAICAGTYRTQRRTAEALPRSAADYVEAYADLTDNGAIEVHPLYAHAQLMHAQAVDLVAVLRDFERRRNEATPLHVQVPSAYWDAADAVLDAAREVWTDASADVTNPSKHIVSTRLVRELDQKLTNLEALCRERARAGSTLLQTGGQNRKEVDEKAELLPNARAADYDLRVHPLDEGHAFDVRCRLSAAEAPRLGALLTAPFRATLQFAPVPSSPTPGVAPAMSPAEKLRTFELCRHDIQVIHCTEGCVSAYPSTSAAPSSGNTGEVDNAMCGRGHDVHCPRCWAADNESESQGGHGG